MKILEKLRALKYKLSHDNLFDLSLGGLVSILCFGIHKFVNFSIFGFHIYFGSWVVVLPILIISILNEFYNMKIGEKHFGYIDVTYRTILGLLLYIIIIL